MREIKKIKLNQFSKDELDQRKMNALKGGCQCARYCNDCSIMCNYIPTRDLSSMVEVHGGAEFMGSDIASY